MVKINEQHLLDEIRFDIKQGDMIKARLVLSSLREMSQEVQLAALSELDAAEDRFAILVLGDVMVSQPDVAESFPQLTETFFSKVMANPDVLMELLVKGEALSMDKVFLGEVAARIQLKSAGPPLLKLLSETEDPDDIVRIMNCLATMGYKEAVNPVSEYLYSGDRTLIAAAIRTLGEMATAEAAEMLGQCIGGDSEIDNMILDVLARSDIPEAVEVLNDVLKSEDASLRAACRQRLGAVGAAAVRVLAKNLCSGDVDLVIHSLNVMGDTGDPSAVGPVRSLLNNHPADANVRFTAYEALGRLPLDKATYSLAAGLEDPVENVRAAAARAIDRNYNAVLGAGIRNMLEVKDADAMKIIAAVIDSECDNILLGLLEAERFQRLALRYLEKQSHAEVRSHFTDVLTQKGYGDLAGRMGGTRASGVRGMPKVFAVDDSRMVLSIYRKVLHNLGCDARMFAFPAGVLERLDKEIPDVVLADLNMPDITGIELTKRIRERFGKEDLPVVIVTTQSEGRDTEASYAVGVNAIVRKPFTEESIRKALFPFLGKLPRETQD